jgi:DNA-binding Xre family transcriptional regulator
MAYKKAKTEFTTFKELRIDRKLTQTELAKRVGISTQYIHLIETGQRKGVTLPIMNKIAKELNVSLDELGKLIN